MSWSPDAKFIASGDMDGRILLWHPSDGRLLGSCDGHKKWITSLVRAPPFCNQLTDHFLP